MGSSWSSFCYSRWFQQSQYKDCKTQILLTCPKSQKREKRKKKDYKVLYNKTVDTKKLFLASFTLNWYKNRRRNKCETEFVLFSISSLPSYTASVKFLFLHSVKAERRVFVFLCLNAVMLSKMWVHVLFNYWKAHLWWCVGEKQCGYTTALTNAWMKQTKAANTAKDFLSPYNPLRHSVPIER